VDHPLDLLLDEIVPGQCAVVLKQIDQGPALLARQVVEAPVGQALADGGELGFLPAARR